MFEHNVIDATNISLSTGKLTMANNGTGNCNVVILNTERDKILLHEFWTNSPDDPVKLFFNDTLVFEFTKYYNTNYRSSGNNSNYLLNVGIYHFSLPPGKSFTVVFLRKDK